METTATHPDKDSGRIGDLSLRVAAIFHADGTPPETASLAMTRVLAAMYADLSDKATELVIDLHARRLRDYIRDIRAARAAEYN